MMSVDAGACMSIYSHSPTHHVAHVATACRQLTCKLQHHCQQPFNAMSCRHVHMRQNQTSNVYHILRQWTRHNAENSRPKQHRIVRWQQQHISNAPAALCRCSPRCRVCCSHASLSSGALQRNCQLKSSCTTSGTFLQALCSATADCEAYLLLAVAPLRSHQRGACQSHCRCQQQHAAANTACATCIALAAHDSGSLHLCDNLCCTWAAAGCHSRACLVITNRCWAGSCSSSCCWCW